MPRMPPWMNGCLQGIKKHWLNFHNPANVEKNMNSFCALQNIFLYLHQHSIECKDIKKVV